MKKRNWIVAILFVSILTVISCGRKGTGCPTFSKAVVTHVLR